MEEERVEHQIGGEKPNGGRIRGQVALRTGREDVRGKIILRRYLTLGAGLTAIR